MKTKIKTLKNKADKLIQELCRLTYNTCYCGVHLLSCGHHYIRRSQSMALRWDIKNIVPVNHECHCKIHRKGDPFDILEITKFMINHWGKDWEQYIIQKKNEVFRSTIGRMREVITRLEDEIKKQA